MRAVPAAIAGGSQVVVTLNVRDVPPDSPQAHALAVVTPAAFLLDELDLYPAGVGRATSAQLTVASRPPLMTGQLRGRLSRAVVPAFADEVRRHEFG